MIKSVRKSLSAKIFLITAVLLAAACSGTFFCIVQIFPFIYSNQLEQNITEKVEILIEEMTEQESVENCYRLLSDFAETEDVSVLLKTEKDGVIYSNDTSSYLDGEIALANNSNSFPFYLNNGILYILVVHTDMKVVNEMMEVLKSVFPCVLIMILVLSLLCSAFYSLYITRPIIHLSSASKKMAELDFSGKCDVRRRDELGILAGNLNQLSDSLSEALSELNAANEQLKWDMEKEREAERKRMDFFAAASHELKTPLTILKGHLSGMLDEVGGYQDHKKYLNRSLVVTEQMEVLVKELLFISRKESDQRAVHFESADLTEIIRSQLAELTDLMISKQISLDLNMPPQLLCMMDSQLMKRAVRNILVNGIQYSPAGEVIRIEMNECHENIRCSVENTGVHIPESSISQVFDAFYRADHSRNRNSGGTGLGLYIVRGILEEHHAEYQIQNTADGVKFTFCLKKSL